MVRNGGLGGLYTPPAPSERIIPTRNGTVPPPQGRGGTWYASTGNVRHVRCGGEDGSSAPKHLGVPSRSLEGHRGWVLHKGTPPLSSQPLLLSLCCP
jgi:hypothetical protein